MLFRPLIALLAALLALTAGAAKPDAGLMLQLKASGKTDARMARSVALHVPRNEPVSPFLETGSFKAVWTGKLHLEKRSRLVFTLEGTGQARLLIDGEVLVDRIGVSNESKRLRSGEHELVCEYEAPAEGDASLRLFWEGRDFGREPVPATAFRHDPTHAELTARMKLRRGRTVLAEKRCASCHQGSVVPAMEELLLKGPSLVGVGVRLRQDWLVKWIANPTAVRPSAHMPAVFKVDAEQSAADIAAYLCKDVPEVESQLAATPA
ncbi:MAG: c-type cytochrome, partial [Acidobacteriota bacterium]|nr:c-type cytochrome [Acidobacteriota bacterium]